MANGFTGFFAALLLFIPLSASHCLAGLPQADKVLVLKKAHKLMLLKNGDILKSYRVALGRQPDGQKLCRGDCKTPEGTYVLDRRNIHSKFYRSIHISYPNEKDVAAAKKKGFTPGRNIMIHGLPRGFEDLGELHTGRDWTKGCLAVTNTEMDEIWRLVPNGTPIEIRP